MKTSWRLAKLLLGALFTFVGASTSFAQIPIPTNQGTNWTSTTRNQFYTQDQGSQIIPLAWFRALKQVNGLSFSASSLGRYGYLPNPSSPVAGLPVGFSTNVDRQTGVTHVGLTCSGCHTRQITVSGVSYRIDGAPAITDVNTFLSDMDSAVAKLLNTQTVFDQFAQTVLGSGNTATAKAALRTQVNDWYLPFHTLMSRSLPTASRWGPGRLDAVSMIFNRVSGLDIGLTPPYMIPENMALADAPARYPFIWNTHLQDYTQWTGFFKNGTPLLGLGRNLGEVIGVFAKFHPVKDSTRASGYDFLQINSGNIPGLNVLESLVPKIGPPKWPWLLDPIKVAAGRNVFYKPDTTQGNKSCNDCHGIRQGEPRDGNTNTWATPILDVGTDSRAANLLTRRVKTGILQGATVPGTTLTLQATDYVDRVLSVAVQGAIAQYYSAPPAAPAESGPRPIGYAYESRVLQGIWAAAPYLHNGSVPSLAELLKPSPLRVSQFQVGPAYNIFTVGLASTQSKFNFTYRTTDCTQRNSGNSRCGHEYGTTFNAIEKAALLEYLKQL